MRIWGVHPLGKLLLMKALRHFEKSKDFEQVGLIAALLFDCERKLHSEQAAKLQQWQVEEKVRLEKFDAFSKALERAVVKESMRPVEKESKFRKTQVQDQIVKRAHVKNLSQGNSKKKQHESGTRVTTVNATSMAKEIKYEKSHNMPNSLKENVVDYLASPKAAQNAYQGLMTKSQKNSQSNS